MKEWPQDYFGARPVLEPRCTCASRDRLILGAVVNYGSPLRCSNCFNEIDPTEILEEWLVSSLAAWSHIHRAILDLLMEVQEEAYSEWARRELETMASSVNRSAIRLLEQINRSYGCVYWSGIAATVDGRCPSCQSLMTVEKGWPSPVLICSACRLVLPTSSVSRLTSA